jgi:creatinine amidohydrolase/Fe(II)-dependent formamide hydrolase-like protein
MLLHLSTWPEVEAYLERSMAIVIPIGSNEQHGPTGLLGTDWPRAWRWRSRRSERSRGLLKPRPAPAGLG